MTQGQKAYAIYRYVYYSYRFTERVASNKQDWKYEAWRGLTTRKGDCFTYSAAAKVLLEKIGAKTMMVSQWGHYWLLVDLGTGWYHFDALNRGPRGRYELFMLTMDQVTRMYPSIWKKATWDYPKTADSPFVRDW